MALFDGLDRDLRWNAGFARHSVTRKCTAGQKRNDRLLSEKLLQRINPPQKGNKNDSRPGEQINIVLPGSSLLCQKFPVSYKQRANFCNFLQNFSRDDAILFPQLI